MNVKKMLTNQNSNLIIQLLWYIVICSNDSRIALQKMRRFVYKMELIYFVPVYFAVQDELIIMFKG